MISSQTDRRRGKAGSGPGGENQAKSAAPKETECVTFGRNVRAQGQSRERGRTGNLNTSYWANIKGSQ